MYDTRLQLQQVQEDVRRKGCSQYGCDRSGDCIQLLAAIEQSCVPLANAGNETILRAWFDELQELAHRLLARRDESKYRHGESNQVDIQPDIQGGRTRDAIQ